MTSKYRGVWKDPRRGLWFAQLRREGRSYALGKFATEEAAARAYDAKATELFGAGAILNFPTGGSRQSLVTRKVARRGSSRYIGVSLERDRRRASAWRACLRIGPNKVASAYARTEREAARLYDGMARQFRGDTAVLNFPN